MGTRSTSASPYAIIEEPRDENVPPGDDCRSPCMRDIGAGRRHRAGRHAARGLSRHQPGASDARSGDRRSARSGLRSRQRIGAPQQRAARVQADRRPAGRHRGRQERRGRHRLPGLRAAAAGGLGTVEFSQTYMLVRQSFLVLDGSPIRAIADVDRAGQKIAGTVNDSITLCMKRILKQAMVVELANDPAELSKALTARTIDALGANRQRLTTLATATPGTRLLPDDLFNVPQNIVVPKDRPAALATVNALIDEARASGFLQSAIERGGAIGVAVAPAGVKAGCPG